MFNRTYNYRGTSIQGTPSRPRKVTPMMEKSTEKRLGWGLLVINQQRKYIFFYLSALESTAVIISSSWMFKKIMINYLCNMYKCSTSIYVR